MTLATPLPILSELRSSTSATCQVAALRALKNEIIGNDQKKRVWIGRGVLSPLVPIINPVNGNGKRRDQHVHSTGDYDTTSLVQSDEEEARIQAIIVVGSLAHGGPAYIPPITASSVIAPLLAILSAADASPRTVLASLKTLNTIADASAVKLARGLENRGKGLVHGLYSDEGLAGLVHLLSQSAISPIVQHQISLAAALVAKTCLDENQRSLLIRKGILEVLGSKLAAFIVAADPKLCSDRGSHVFPDSLGKRPTACQSRLAPILGAIARIVDTSKSRAITFLSTPALTTVFLRLEAEVPVPHEKRANSWSHHGSASASNPPLPSRPLDCLLPQIPSYPSKASLSESNCHPPLGAIGTSTRQPYCTRISSQAQDLTHGQSVKSPQDEENPLIPWLIFIARAESGVSRLRAAWIISLFYRSGLVDKQRESSLAMVLVPLLVRVLDKDTKSLAEIQSTSGATPHRPTHSDQEQAPAILAMLTLDSLDLQRAAVDAGAIKKLAQLLKESYDPLPLDSTASQWNPDPVPELHPQGDDETSRLGDSTISRQAYQVIRVREAALMALTSLASTRDDYRKAIIETGVVPFVIESLKMDSLQGDKPQGKSPVDYPNQSSRPKNTTGVILAACGAARSLSRSVSTLRTSLMDAGLAAPLFMLLKHQDLKVQIAATAVVSNLVLEFSPMREAILEAGVLKTLCEHAHSMDPNLRLSSIWALKHLVLSAPGLLKKECLGELGPGWLKQIICSEENDTTGFRSDQEASVGTPLAMGTPNAAGEQVDLLNATDGFREGRPIGTEDDEADVKMVDSVGASGGPQLDFEQQGQNHSAWRAPRKRTEASNTNQVRADELAVQKQGLDFIRNLICGSDSLEMIDCLFEELGQDKVFEILVSKLRPRLINAFNRDRRSTDSGVRQIQPPTDIVISVCYIIVHLAAGLPRHRQLVISQPELLKLIVPLFQHSNREVRGCCAWIVINLTWMDDQSDHVNCKERAKELIRLGIYEKLQMLEADPELDVRERTKTAMYQLSGANR